MYLYKFKFDGIYDTRTLLELKRQEVDHFSFDFNPRSFNFIQERVFIELLVGFMNETDKVYLHFIHNKDFMVQKIYSEILKIRGNMDNVFFEFDEFFSDVELPRGLKFFLLYLPSIFLIQTNLDNLVGFIFPYDLIKKIHEENKLSLFYSNFLTHFKSAGHDSRIFILKLEWNQKINQKLLDIFDFNIVSLPLNSEIEVCYRNVDLTRLKLQLDIKKELFRTHEQSQGF
jgi:hypothetical protein